MNGKKAKMMRKEVRSHIKAGIGDGMNILNRFTRQRPKYIPKIIWIILYLPIIKIRYVKYFIKHI